MISVSNEFKQAITLPRQLDGKIVIGSDTITSEQFYSIERIFKTDLFKTVMKQVIVDSQVPIDKGSVINPQLGVYVGDDFEYLSLGNYTATKEPNLNKDTKSYQISAYDKIVESMVDYGLTISDITYPCSVRDLFVAIFTKLGWSTSGIPQTFTNSTSLIEEDVYSNANMTYRSVLDELCTISCMFLLEKNGIPSLIQKNTTSEIIDEHYINNTNVTIKEKIYFNSLVFSRASESDNIFRNDSEDIELNGLHEYKVSDLQILSLNWRDNFIDEMWNYIKTFEYYSYDIDTKGIGFLEPIDEFTLRTFQDDYNTLLLSSDLVLRSGLKENINADAPKETQTDYKYASSTDRLKNQTYLIVDKQNQQIEALVNRVDEEESKISQLTITSDNIQTNVSTMNDTLTNQISALQTSTSLQINAISQTLENGVEKLSNSLVTIDTNGINTSRADETFNTQITNKTFEVKDGDRELAFMGYDSTLNKTISRIDELESRKATIGVHRCETITRNGKKRTAWFFVGGGN